MREVFDLLYGPTVRLFSSDSGKWTEVEFKTAELMCGRRYARGLGRSDTASYRWVQTEGKVTRRLSNILGKIVEICADEIDPRERFESIVGPILAMRGIDLDHETPMPTLAAVRRTTAGRRVSVGDDEASTVVPEYLGGAFS